MKLHCQTGLNGNLSLLATDYIESDIDAVTRQMQALHPGKRIRVLARSGGFQVTITETVHVALKNGKVQPCR